MRDKNTWTESKVFTRLESRFPTKQGAFVLVPQVRNGVGLSRAVDRTADAIVASTWPSRGLWFGGIEIKVSLSDWRKELASPDKADGVMKFCRHWWIAAPKGVVPQSEIPGTWGLLEVTKSRVFETTPAPIRDFDQPDLSFLCSVLRATQKSTVPAADFHEKVEEARAKAVEHAKKSATWRFKEMQETIAAFEKASGVDLTKTRGSWDGERIGDAVAFVIKHKITGVRGQAKRLRDQAQSIVKNIDEYLNS